MPAVVVGSEVGEVVVHGKYSLTTEYFPRVRFRYTLPGGEYESSRLALVPGDPQLLDGAGIEKVLAAYPVGADVTALVDPKNPRMAALRTEVTWTRRSHLWANLMAGVLLVLAACVVAAVT